jgi:hypothetical protein
VEGPRSYVFPGGSRQFLMAFDCARQGWTLQRAAIYVRLSNARKS